MKLRSIITLCVILAALVGALSLSVPASANGPQGTTSISFTVTTTTNYPMQTGGLLMVNFDSVQIDSSAPQAYSFGVRAQTAPTLYITRLHWEFGDGSYLDVPYCCQSLISEVRYHAYPQEGTYTAVVVAFDNAGNFGDTFVTVSWPTPVPEYPSYGLPLLLSLFAVLAAAGLTRGKNRPFSGIR